jgi:hypothetical protein
MRPRPFGLDFYDRLVRLIEVIILFLHSINGADGITAERWRFWYEEWRTLIIYLMEEGRRYGGDVMGVSSVNILLVRVYDGVSRLLD